MSGFGFESGFTPGVGQSWERATSIAECCVTDRSHGATDHCGTSCNTPPAAGHRQNALAPRLSVSKTSGVLKCGLIWVHLLAALRASRSKGPCTMWLVPGGGVVYLPASSLRVRWAVIPSLSGADGLVRCSIQPRTFILSNSSFGLTGGS